MELSSQEAEIPMPINSVYGGGVHSHGHAHQEHMTHHHHYHQQELEPPPSSTTTTSHNHNIIPSTSSTQMPSNNPNGSNIENDNSALNLEDQQPYNTRDCNPSSKINNNNNNTGMVNKKLMTRYRECQKNHAASMGGKATDGCGEFMPSGEEGSIEALICSACNCHRNFHRKEIDGDNNHQIPPPPGHHFYLPTPQHHPHHILSTQGRKVILGSGGGGSRGGGQGFLGYHTGIGARALIPVSRTTVPINVPSDQSDEHDHGGRMMVRAPHQLVKKRHRTKFSQEQKEKMLEFAEKVGWKIQKQEDSVVQQFCQEVGVKRRVFKVWMHNNKHTFAKKNNLNTNNNNDNSSSLN